LAGADLRGADLTDAVLSAKTLSGTRFDRSTKWPPEIEASVFADAVEIDGGAYEVQAPPEEAASGARRR
jgi:hypothetical protein